jgi:hypothetical protein
MKPRKWIFSLSVSFIFEGWVILPGKRMVQTENIDLDHRGLIHITDREGAGMLSWNIPPESVGLKAIPNVRPSRPGLLAKNDGRMGGKSLNPFGSGIS